LSWEGTPVQTRRSEAFWRDQRDHEIDADSERNGEAKHGFKHGGLSDARYESRIKREKPKGADAQGQEDDVRHGFLHLSVY
jgi:hypothetical protein